MTRGFVESLLQNIKEVVFPKGACCGIYSSEVDESCKRSMDMFQVLRHTLAWNKEPLGGWSIVFDTPTQFSKSELIKCKISDQAHTIDEEENK